MTVKRILLLQRFSHIEAQNKAAQTKTSLLEFVCEFVCEQCERAIEAIKSKETEDQAK